MQLAFIDESGSPAPQRNEKYFVVAALTMSSDRGVKSQLKRIRQSLGIKKRGKEIKAAHSRVTIIKRFLKWLGEQDYEIYAVVVDLQEAPTNSGEQLYQRAIIRVITHCLGKYPHLHVYVDRRYTNHRQIMFLEEAIRHNVSHIAKQVLLIEQVDSAMHSGVQAADFIAWALRKKYEFGETWAVELIENKIVVEEWLENKKCDSAR